MKPDYWFDKLHLCQKRKNRGTEIANNVKVRGYHSRSGAGLLLPDDIQPLTTAELSVGTCLQLIILKRK